MDDTNKGNMTLYKGRIPRALLLIGSFLGLLGIILVYFHKGPMVLDPQEGSFNGFNSYGKLIIATITYILLLLVSIRANFKCHQVTCPAVFSIIFLLAYYSYPPLLRYWGIILFIIALYIIIRTLFHHKNKDSE